MAASLGHLEIFIIIIERTGAKNDLVNQNLATPLHLACQNNQIEIVRFLMGCGVDVNLQDEFGQTPILIASKNGNLEILQIIIEAYHSGHLTEALEVNLPDHEGNTPLNYAIIKGNFEIVKCLVARGMADINAAGIDGNSPLINAGRNGHASIIEFLISNNASLLKQDNFGGTLLHHAVEKGHIKVLETLITLGADIYSAIEIADNAGRTPLFEAVENLNDNDIEFQMQILKILLKSKSQNGFQANQNVVNYNGQTPLFIAARQGQICAVKLLIQSGAQVDLNNGESLKELTMTHDYSTEQEKLMDAYINCMTPLHIAAVLGFDEIVFYLVECNADVNLQSKQNKLSVLHLCVLANKPEIIVQLLNKTDVNFLIEDRQHRNVFDLLQKYIPSQVELIEKLLEKRQPQKFQDTNERQIIVKTQDEMNSLYKKEEVQLANLKFEDLETDQQPDQRIEEIFGRKVALCLLSQNWQFREQALKFILHFVEKYFATSDQKTKFIPFTLVGIADAILTAVQLTCHDKIIKVFSQSLLLFNLLIYSSKIERDPIACKKVQSKVKTELLIAQFLQYSETSNAKITNKIQEFLVDLGYQQHLNGDELIINSIYHQLKQESTINSKKGLQIQLQLLFKLVTTFQVKLTPVAQMFDEDYYCDEGPPPLLSKQPILEAILPVVAKKVDNSILMILIEVQKQTGELTREDLDQINDEKLQDEFWGKIQQVQICMTQPKQKLGVEQVEKTINKYKLVIIEKATHKDWTQRELALNAMTQCFTLFDQFEEEFLERCSILLLSSLNENNIQIYLVAIELCINFIQKYQDMDFIKSILQSVVVRTTDTNTRVRKRSVDVINQIWNLSIETITISQLIGNVLCDPALNEKAIAGRLGLFIKKIIHIEDKEDINNKPIQLIIGRDYEQLTQFACQWCTNKHTKVRQSALKLIVEICRVNCLDPKGLPFKKRIVSYILGLRTSIREPLIKKINEICGGYFNEQEEPCLQSNLPLIQQNTQIKIIVLPHSEPLSDSQKEQYQELIQLFGINIVTCLYSQTWSSRQIAIQKIQEQLHNLDPNQRDAMTAEINYFTPESSFKIIQILFNEGLKDPVLKNYIAMLQLIQTILPLYFKYLRPEYVKRGLQPLIKLIINKTSDLKQKVREASINFCLHLSHQPQIGSEQMVSQVFSELDQIQWEKKTNTQSSCSNMIISCIHLLTQIWIQSPQDKFYNEYTKYLNKALKHQNPNVRKQAESLFKILYLKFGEPLQKELVDQKSQLMQKLVSEQSQILTINQNDSLNQECVKNLFNEELLLQLQVPNAKKRLLAIIEVKKFLQQKFQKSSIEMTEPLTLLLRFLLKDENIEIYLESLSLLKFIVSNLAQHLGTLDLHLMLGQLIQILALKQHQNLKQNLASDQVLVYFAKHQDIGPFVVAKEIVKNIERFNKKDKQSIVRLYTILQKLLLQFSIVLCYEQNFFNQLLDVLAESFNKFSDEPLIKSTCQNIIEVLFQIDSKQLDNSVQQLDFSKKTHIKKIIIDLQNSKGFVQNQCPTTPVSPRTNFRDTVSSFQSINSRINSIPNSSAITPVMNRRQSKDSHRQSQDRKTPEQTIQAPNWLERKISVQTKNTQPSLLNTQVLPMLNNTRRQIGQGYQTSSKAAGFNRNDYSDLITRNATLSDMSGKIGSGEDTKPLFVHTQRTLQMPQVKAYQPTIIQRYTTLELNQILHKDSQPIRGLHLQ